MNPATRNGELAGISVSANSATGATTLLQIDEAQ